MDDSTLLKICLACSFLGVIALFLIVMLFPPPLTQANALGSAKEGDSVRLSGMVLSVSQKDAVAKINVGNYDPVSVVVFEDGKLQLKQGQDVTVLGRVQEYKGKNELVADEITIRN